MLYDALIETLTFLFTDIEGSTALLQRVGTDTYSAILELHHQIIRTGLRQYAGSEQGTQGDSFFAVFTAPSACLAAAVQLQRELAAATWPSTEQPRVRMGIHTGEVLETPTGLVGYEVNRAARIAAVGYGGQILLSSAVAGLVTGNLPSGVFLRDLGSHRLKDLGQPETVFQLVSDGLISQFPPLRSLGNPDLANNLPLTLSPFVGRRAELADVRTLIHESRIVTLTGAGGSGKTRLALQASADLLDGAGHGVWFVDLAPLNDADQLASMVIATLEFRKEPDRTPLDSLLTSLRYQHSLIILDNCEHLVDPVAALVSAISQSCPHVTIVATTREPLGLGGERVYRVRSLSLPPEEVERAEDLRGSDAVELFVLRARSHDATFVVDDASAALIASVCARLDGIPLAIELAASRLSSMSLADLHDRLDQRFRLLTGGSRNVLPRQQTLGAMVAWSYDLLSELERDVLRRLSVFAGSFDLRAVEYVCATETSASRTIADVVGSLVNKSLIGTERSSVALRYRLLETIRQYAADQLIQVNGELDTLATRRRHADFYLEWSESLGLDLDGPNQGPLMRRLDAEYDNLQTAFRTITSDPSRHADALRLGVALTAYLRSRQHQFPIAVLRSVLESDEDFTPSLKARALLCVATFNLTQSGEAAHRIANGYLSEAVRLAQSLDDRALEVESLTWLSIASRQLGREEAMLEQARDALRIARLTNEPQLIGLALFALGGAQSDTVEGREHCIEAVANFRQAGNLRMVALTESIMIIGFLQEGKLDEARFIVDEAIGIAETLDLRLMVLSLYSGKGEILYLTGDFEGAEEIGRRALRAVRRLGVHPDLMYWVMFTLECCAASRGDWARGAQLCGAHEMIEEGLSVPDRGSWSPLEVAMRTRNRTLLVDALGEEAFTREHAIGQGRSFDAMITYALGLS